MINHTWYTARRTPTGRRGETTKNNNKIIYMLDLVYRFPSYTEISSFRNESIDQRELMLHIVGWQAKIYNNNIK